MTVDDSQAMNDEVNLPSSDPEDMAFVSHLRNNNLSSIIQLYLKEMPSERKKFRDNYMAEQRQHPTGQSDTHSSVRVSPPQYPGAIVNYQRSPYVTPTRGQENNQTVFATPPSLYTENAPNVAGNVMIREDVNTNQGDDLYVERLKQSNGGVSVKDLSNPSNKEIMTATETLWKKTKFPRDDDWVFSGLYCRRIQRSMNVTFREGEWKEWRDRLKRQLNRKRTSVTQQVKDEYIGK